MRHESHKELVLPHVTVELATITWDRPGHSPPRETHALFQRLSRDHSPLRLGNISAYDLLPRLHSVGFLPAGSSVPLEPIEKPLQVLSCFYDADFVEQKVGLSRADLTKHATSLAVLRTKRLEVLMREVHAELDQPGTAHEFLIEALTDVMIVEVARIVGQLDRRRGSQPIVLALSPWQLLRLEERIKAAPEGGYPALSELAALCGVSEGHLARAFKATTGWQIHKYIAHQRIRTAGELLAETNLSCEAIARNLGYSSASYFSTAFRAMTGKSPSQFRRQALAAKAAEQA